MLHFECVSVVAVSGLTPVLLSPSTNLSGPVPWAACSRTRGKQSLESAQVFLGDACSVLRHRSAPKTPPTAVCLNNSPCSYLQRHLHPAGEPPGKAVSQSLACGTLAELGGLGLSPGPEESRLLPLCPATGVHASASCGHLSVGGYPARWGGLTCRLV